MIRASIDGQANGTQGLETFDLEVPLHPTTHSCDDVATLVAGVLASIDRHQARGRPVAHADIVQALAIAAAVQNARHEASKRLRPGLGISFRGLALESRPAQTVNA
jgi:hypothetical protein